VAVVDIALAAARAAVHASAALVQVALAPAVQAADPASATYLVGRFAHFAWIK
jgi:hypothetical protein